MRADTARPAPYRNRKAAIPAAVFVLVFCLPLAGQEPAKPGAAKPEAPQAPSEAKPAAPAAEGAPGAESPVPVTEKAVQGSVDVGYRWRSDVRGNFQSYRSVVDLGEGPKLLNLDFTFQSKRFFDRLDLRGIGWGGDPYNTARLDARKSGLYNLTVDYRRIAYFNALPSFANPLNPAYPLTQHSFDTHRRIASIELDLMPGRRFVPYLAYSRDSGDGRGVTTFVTTGNEYPVATLLRDKTDNFRGGVRVEMNRFHVTLEQGGTTFKDDQRAFTSLRNPGNRSTPFLGETLFLDSLEQQYGIRGDSVYSKVLLTANPVSSIDIYGQFLYSRPQTDSNYVHSGLGTFATTNPVAFFTGQQNLLFAQAKQPHTSGMLGGELRPFRRLRIIESWMTDRLHDASAGLLTEQLLLSAVSGQTQSSLAGSRLVRNYSQIQTDVLFDITQKITLRGGFRSVWGDAQVLASVLNQTGPFEFGKLRRQAGLAGVTARVAQKLSFNVDFEAATSDRDYFRTSLHDYQKARVRARYQPTTSLGLAANFSVLNNQNPSPGVNYDFRSRDNSLTVYWTPGGGRRAAVTADYSRSTLRSDIQYLSLPFFDPERSFYRDNAHTGTVLVDLRLPPSNRSSRFTLGGSYFLSNGSRPSRYYQPLARVAIPLYNGISWIAEWRWYGFGEQFYLFEGFRAHVFATGLRIGR